MKTATPKAAKATAKKDDESLSSVTAAKTEPETGGPVPPPLPSRDSAEPGNERVSVKIVDGKLDRESFRAASAEKIKAAIKASLADAEFCEWAGIGSQITGIPPEELFSDEQFGMLLDVLVKFEVVFMAGKTGLKSEQVGNILEWTPAEHKILDAQGARLMRRYVPAEWLGRLDLWIFILSFLSLTAAKMKRVTEFAAVELERIGKASQPVASADATEKKAA